MNYSRKQSAFTIVELLIVIVVIAILAAISIVAYNGIQERARASAAVAALNQSRKAINLWQIDNPDTAPDCDKFKELTTSTGASCTGAGVMRSDVTYQYSPSTTIVGAYCITATIGSTSYSVTGTSQPISGGCGGHGVGGVQAITNYAVNPSVENDSVGWANRWYGSGGNGTTSRTSAAASCGSYGLRKVWNTQGTGQDVGYDYGNPAQAGTVYRLSVRARASFQTSMRIWISFIDSSGNAIGSNQGDNLQSTNANTWYTLTATATAPAGTARLRTVFGPYPNSDPGMNVLAGSTVDTDCMMITSGASQYSFADGNSLDWIWNGTPNSATSTGPIL